MPDHEDFDGPRERHYASSCERCSHPASTHPIPPGRVICTVAACACWGYREREGTTP